MMWRPGRSGTLTDAMANRAGAPEAAPPTPPAPTQATPGEHRR